MAALGDVFRIIPNPFQIGRDAENRKHRAQIGRCRRAQGQNARGFLVHLGFQGINGRVPCPHQIGQFRVARVQSQDRFMDRVLDQPAHLHDPRLNAL